MLKDARPKKKVLLYNPIYIILENGKTNILVGTQMITKGLDFDNVSLVGVLNADNMLNYPDFRAFERAFQLLMQVSGRAGRKNKQGKVIIQTNNPQHDIFKYLQNYDNQIVINRLLNERKQFYYPPYCRIVKICLQHKDLSLLNNIATDYVALLRQYVHTPIFGPEDALIPKIKNMFRKEILIKLPIDRKLSINKKSIVDCWEEMKKRKRCSSVFYIVDVDPY